MSLYIGKDVNGTSVLHVTKGSTSISNMRTGILDDTVFHSDMQFLNYKEFGVVSSSRNLNCVTSRVIPPVVPVSYVPFTGMPIEAVNLLKEGHTFILTDDTYKQVGIRGSDRYGESYYGCNPKESITNTVFRKPSLPNRPGYMCGALTCSYDDPLCEGVGAMGMFSVPPTKILIFNLKHSGEYVDWYPKVGNSVTINRDDLIVRGVDFSDLRYIQSKEEPGTRAITSFLGSAFYEVNSTASSGTFRILSTSAGTVVRKGTNTIINSINPPISSHLNSVKSYHYSTTIDYCPVLTPKVYICDVSSFIGKTVLISYSHTRRVSSYYTTTPFDRTTNSSYLTKFIDNTVIGSLDYNTAFADYYNGIQFYGSFNQAVLSIHEGILYISGTTSCYPWSYDGMSFNGGYWSPYEDIQLLNGVINLCIF